MELNSNQFVALGFFSFLLSSRKKPILRAPVVVVAVVVAAVVAVVGTLELYLGGIELTVFFFVLEYWSP